MDKYYRILNLAKGAGLPDIKKAFRKAVQKYHPDANGGIGNPHKFKEVVSAYHCLQEHHKTHAIKPFKDKKTRMKDWVKGYTERRRTNSRVKKATAWKKRRQYTNIQIDPLVLQLSFEELRFRITHTENDHVKIMAARALALLFGTKAVFIFKKELRSASFKVRDEIIHILAMIGSREAAQLLGRYVRHPNVKIACSAVSALQNINLGYARAFLNKLEKEGRALRSTLSHFYDSIQSRSFVSSAQIDSSDFNIAKALRKNTRQSLPTILRELGWVIPA